MGTFDTHGGYFAPKDYMKVEAGGSHEENPNGGVQIGVDQQGVPNLLEEGEPVYKDYVYSDNIKASERFLKENNIPEKYAGELYSKIADSFFSEAENRPNDPISRNGLEAMLGRLADAQEGQKAYNEQRKLERELKQLSPDELAALEQMLTVGEQQIEQQPMQEQPGMMPEEQMMQEQAVAEQPMVQEQVPVEQPMMRCGGPIGRKYEPGGPVLRAQSVISNPAIITADDPKRIAFENQIRQGSNDFVSKYAMPTALSLAGDPLFGVADMAYDALKGTMFDSESANANLAEIKPAVVDGKTIDGLWQNAAGRFVDEKGKLLSKQDVAHALATNQERALNGALAKKKRIPRQLDWWKPKTKLGKVAKGVSYPLLWMAEGEGIRRAWNWGEDLINGMQNAREGHLASETPAEEATTEFKYGGPVNIFKNGEPEKIYPEQIDYYLSVDPYTNPYTYIFGNTGTGASGVSHGGGVRGVELKSTSHGGGVRGENIMDKGVSTSNGGGVRGGEVNPLFGLLSSRTFNPNRTVVPTQTGYIYYPPVESSTTERTGSGVGRYGTIAGYMWPGMVNVDDISTSDPEDIVVDPVAPPTPPKPGSGNGRGTARKTAVTPKPEIMYDFKMSAPGQLNLPKGPGIDTSGYGLGDGQGSLIYSADNVPADSYAAMPSVASNNSTSVQGRGNALLSTFPRYAGAIGSGILGLYNAFQKPDEYKATRYKPFVPTGRINLQNQVYNPVDQNMLMNQALAQGNSTMRGLRNSGLGPSTQAAMIAQDNNITGNVGNTFLQAWDANNQRRNAVIAANNQAEAQRAQFDYAVDAARQRALADAQMRNAYMDLQLQQLNNEAEGAKYAAVSNQISNALQALSGIGKENFAMNQVNTNPYNEGYGVLGNGSIAYAPWLWNYAGVPKEAKKGGKVQRKKK